MNQERNVESSHASSGLKVSKVCILGLDCASPELVFKQWKDDLPTLSSLCRQGFYGPLCSTIPPITVPAWTSMVTGLDPGQLGLYGFRNRRSYSYDDLFIADARHVQQPRIWDLIGETGRRSIVLGVPLTYPPERIHGFMVSGCLTPDKSAQYTYPRWLKAKINGWAGGEYIIDVENFRTEEKERLLETIYVMTRARFKLAGRMLEEEWDFFMMVEMGLDRIHHGFWRFHDPGHRLYDPGNPYKNAIHDYYIELDTLIGGLLERIPDDTLVLVVSDHGVKRMQGGIAINEWLRREGLLVLNHTNAEGGISSDLVDWSRTRVWGEGGYYSRLFFNVEGREPHGILPASEYQTFRDRMMERLEAMKDPDGNPLGNKVFIPERIYREVKGVPPDLILFLGNLGWRSLGTVGGDIYYLENDTGPDDANHDMDGILVTAIKGRTLPSHMTVEDKQTDATIYDIAPTVLDVLNISKPSNMAGVSLMHRAL